MYPQSAFFVSKPIVKKKKGLFVWLASEDIDKTSITAKIKLPEIITMYLNTLVKHCDSKFYKVRYIQLTPDSDNFSYQAKNVEKTLGDAF